MGDDKILELLGEIIGKVERLEEDLRAENGSREQELADSLVGQKPLGLGRCW